MNDINALTPKILVGVDIGGTKVAVLVTQGEEEIARKVNPTQLTSPEETLTGIIETVKEAVSLAHAELSDVAAIGLGIPGRVDPSRGIVELAVNLKWQNMDVGQALEQSLGVPCFLENDVRMAALGVQYHPQFAQFNHLAYFSIGTGIAAGIILNGELYRGVNGMAGEIGHISPGTSLMRCQCGAWGCLEAVAAGPAIETRMAELILQQNGNQYAEHSTFTAGQVFQLSAQGDGNAREIITQIGRYLGWAIKLLVLTYDLQLIVLGGGVARAGIPFLDAILQNVNQQRVESELARAMLRPEMIQLLPGDFEAPLWGGIALAKAGLRKIQNELIRR